MVSNIASMITPSLAWSGITIIPVIELGLRIIKNLGLLLQNRCEYYYARVTFSPISFTKESNYIDATRCYFLELNNKCLDKEIEIFDNLDSSPPIQYLNLKLKNSTKVYSVHQERFKEYSGTYRNLSQDFLSRGEVNYPPSLKKFKSLIIPDSFSKRNFHNWTGYVRSEKYDEEDLNQTKEFNIPDYFSEKTFDNLNDYFSDCAQFNKKTFDLKSILELYKLGSYLEMPILEERCYNSILENIYKLAKTEFTLEEIAELNKIDGLKIRIDELLSLCNEIEEYKTEYKDLIFPEKLADLELNKIALINQIFYDILLTAACGIVSLYPTLLPFLYSYHLIGFKTLIINYPFAAKCYGFVLFSSGSALLPLGILSRIEDGELPYTFAVIKAVANSIQAIAKKILFAVNQTGKYIQIHFSRFIPIPN